MVAPDLLLIGSGHVSVEGHWTPTYILQCQFQAKHNLYTAIRTNMVDKTDNELRGFQAKSLPTRLAWNKELIWASPGPEWLKMRKKDVGSTIRQTIHQGLCCGEQKCLLLVSPTYVRISSWCVDD